MSWDPATQHKTIMAVDIAGYNGPQRTTAHQLAVHEGFWGLLRTSFAEVGIPWDVCFIENTGDGAMIQLPDQVAKADLVAQFPDRLLAELRRHNAVHAEEANIQLRVALHAGEVHQASHGTVSQATSFTFRILDAPEAKSALKRSGAAFVLIVSDRFYRDVVVHDPAADPPSYRRIQQEMVKETTVDAWLRLFGGNSPAVDGKPSRGPAAVNGKQGTMSWIQELTELLLDISCVADENSRRLLLSHLRPEIGTMVAYHPQARMHVMELVRTCLRYEGGVAELVGVVQLFDPGSVAVRRLVERVAGWGTL